MSRFDRRLKGAGLKPGESTCKVREQQSNYAGMSWGRQNNLGNQNLQQPQQQNMSYETSSVDDGYGFEALHGHRGDEVSADTDVPHRIQPSFGIDDTAP